MFMIVDKVVQHWVAYLFKAPKFGRGPWRRVCESDSCDRFTDCACPDG